MKFPRLKNALLCRILVYLIVLGSFIAPVIIVASLGFIPEFLKIIIGIVLIFCLLIYLIKNFAFLMAMDIGLAVLHCHNSARKCFVLPPFFSVQKVEKRISQFGKKYEPITISSYPKTFQYKSKTSIIGSAKRVEKIILTYHTEFLDKNSYHIILNSAKANAKNIKMECANKEAKLNQVAVIVIYAKQVEEKFRSSLFDVISKNGGDGFNTAVLPCVVDLEKEICTFDSKRIPYTGFQYPIKNSGIKIIRKYLFNNKFPFSKSSDTLEVNMDFNPEQSLWSFWRMTKKEVILNNKKAKKRFEKMEHRTVIFEDGYIYLKWKENGLWVSAELNEELKTVEIDDFYSWDYPKSNKIAKDTIKDIKNLINTYFTQIGYNTKYITYDE